MNRLLRFYPDYTAYSALWLMDEQGVELGLTSFDRELPEDLRQRIEAWVRRWEWFTNDGPDSGAPEQRESWRASGRRLLAEVRSALEPLGWRIEGAFEDEPEATLQFCQEDARSSTE